MGAVCWVNHMSHADSCRVIAGVEAVQIELDISAFECVQLDSKRLIVI